MSHVNFEVARRNMVEHQVRCCKVLDPRVLTTMSRLPREEFLPAEVRSLAYMEGRVPLPCGQEMFSPLQEATILQTLALQGTERVLEIGAGSGFLTTMLALHAREVVSFEIHPELAELARNNLARHGLDNASITTGNGFDSSALAALGQFDAIVVGGALSELPNFLRNSLRPGGTLMAFVGKNPVVALQKMVAIGNGWHNTILFETLLLDMEGVSPKREFIF